MILRVLSLLLAGVLVASAQSPTPAPTPAKAEAGPVNDGTFVPEFAREAAGEGNSAFGRRDYERARRSYKKALDLAPDNLFVLVNLGVVEFYAKNFPEAERLLKRAVQIKLDSAPAWLTLGIMYMDDGRLDEALAALSQATLYDPRNARARNYLEVVVGRKGWIDAAQDELRKAINIDPNYTDAQYNLAVFLLENKPPSIELARRHYFRAVELGAEPDAEIEATLKNNVEPEKK